MQITTVQWNIGGGKILSSGSNPTTMSPYSESGLDYLVDSTIQNQNDIGIAFIGGAGLQSWIWDEVIAQIKVPTATVTFAELDKQSSLDDYVTTVLDQLSALNTARVVIVGHSIGGVVGIELAKKLGARLAGFVAISAVIPEPGKSYLSAFPPQQRLLMHLIFKLAGTKPPEAIIRNGLCQGVDNEHTDRIVKDFRPEAVKLYTDSTTTAPLPGCPALYISTLTDKDLPLPLQERMAKNLPSAKVVTINSGHLPMLSRPSEIVTYINEFLEQL